MIIQSGILLNVLVSSACFRHADVIHFRPSTRSGSDQAAEGDESVRSFETDSRHVTAFSLYVSLQIFFLFPDNFISNNQPDQRWSGSFSVCVPVPLPILVVGDS